MSSQPTSDLNGTTLRLGTRGSLLARAQSQLVANQLMEAWPSLRVELKLITTSGDRMVNQSLAEAGGKGLFTKELELALLNNEIDFAVHSYKDVPVTMPLVNQDDLIVAAAPKREDAGDVIVMFDPKKGLGFPGARIGTSSLRRRCQILEQIPDARITPLRGNIDTRLRKLRDGEFDLIVLAAAGLKRAGLYDDNYMRSANLIPAPAQGALALQCRRSDAQTRQCLAALNDNETAACVNAERALVAKLRGDCHSPIAAHATVDADRAEMTLSAAVGGHDGNPPVLRAKAVADLAHVRIDVSPLVDRIFMELAIRGAMGILHGT